MKLTSRRKEKPYPPTNHHHHHHHGDDLSSSFFSFLHQLQTRIFNIVFSHWGFLWLRITLLSLAIHTAFLIYRSAWILPLLQSYWNDVIAVNPILLGVFGTASLGAPPLFTHFVLLPLWRHVRSMYISSVDIQSMDPVFSKVQDFICSLPHEGIGVHTDMEAKTKPEITTARERRRQRSGTAMRSLPDIQYVSRTNATITVHHNGVALWVTFKKQGGLQVTGFDRELRQAYTMTIQTMGREYGIAAIKSFIVAALRFDLRMGEGDMTNIYVLSNRRWLGTWEKVNKIA